MASKVRAGKLRARKAYTHSIGQYSFLMTATRETSIHRASLSAVVRYAGSKCELVEIGGYFSS